jgi:large subunit ribosomal protein L6
LLRLLIGGLNMSRIGKLPISIPAGVTVNFDEKTNLVSVKGPKGELSQKIDSSIKFENKDGQITFSVDENSPVDYKQKQAFHGLYRSLVNNMVIGVSEGYTKVLELVGVGYRVSNQGNVIEFSLGYTHPIFMQLPKEVKVETKSERNQNPILTLESCDKALLGLICAKIRSFRMPEPYKGKGILFKGEVIRRKSGKTAAAK